MKKSLLAAASIATLLAAPVAAIACMDESMSDVSMGEGMTNVTALDRMTLRVDKLVSAKDKMMKIMSGTPMRPYSHDGRPNMRSLRTATRKRNNDRMKSGRYKTVKPWMMDSSKSSSSVSSAATSASSVSSMSSSSASSM